MSFCILVVAVALIVISLLVLFAGNREKANTLIGVWKDADSGYIYDFKEDNTLSVDMPAGVVNADYEIVERNAYSDKAGHVSYRFINCYYSKDRVVSRSFEIKDGVLSFYEVLTDGNKVAESSVLTNKMTRLK